MDTDLNIIQLYDHGHIRGIMLHSDILPTIIDDTWDGSYAPDPINEMFLGCVVDGTLIGLYRLHWITGVTLQGHAHILKEFRKEHSIESCKSVMRWVIEHLERCKKVDCYVPTLYPNVKHFLAACGFKEEGVSRNSFMLKGQLYDRTVMGITRDEMKQVVK